MTYENPYLPEFAPIFWEIVKAKNINPAHMELIILDEKPKERQIFTQTGVKDVLNQLCDDLNALTIYTDRPDFFGGFAERVCEENGLLVMMHPKREQNKAWVLRLGCETALVLDFERKGACYHSGRGAGFGYIPIHKKPWEITENLDIAVPFGYNTVIVKGKDTNDRKFVNDRFEEGFYRDE